MAKVWVRSMPWEGAEATNRLAARGVSAWLCPTSRSAAAWTRSGVILAAGVVLGLRVGTGPVRMRIPVCTEASGWV